LAKFTPLAVTDLSALSGNVTTPLIQWGNSGLAFILQSGCCGSTTNQVALVNSPSMLLTAGATKNPLPVANSLSPASATHGSFNFSLTIHGTGFVPGSQVTWNGAALFAGYVSSTQLTVYVPASSVASAGTATLVVTNPAPAGGASAALTFTIN
jgi:trimeric autotransporter adhesin